MALFLLALSVVASLSAAALSLKLASLQIRAGHQMSRVWWPLSAVALSAGLGTTHVLGILARFIDAEMLRYGAPHLVFFLLLSFTGSLGAVMLATRRSPTRPRILTGSILFGTTLAAAHMIVVAGLQDVGSVLDAGEHLFITLFFSSVSFYLGFRVTLLPFPGPRDTQLRSHRFGTILLGLGLVAAHYFGLWLLPAEELSALFPLLGDYWLNGSSLVVVSLLGGMLLLLISLFIPPIRRELLRRSRMASENARLAKESQTMNRRLETLLKQMEVRTREAEEANRIKSEFLAVMSHELRTPLTAVIGYSELLLEDIPVEVPTEAKDSVERIRRSADHLLSLIEDLLTFSRKEADSDNITFEETSPVEIVKEVVSLMRPLAEAKGIPLRIDTTDTPDSVLTDARKTRQVLLNLLSNAVKFTDEGEVSVSLRQTQADLAFDVSDTGRGLSEEEQKRLFDPFWQAEDSLTRTSGGTGLGLPISLHLASLLGGKLEVMSEFGKGSTFSLVLPLRKSSGKEKSQEPENERDRSLTR